jgi:hypothetical protein
MPLWQFEAKPGTTLEKLQSVYLSGFDAIDRFDAKRNELSADKRYTDAGRKDHLLEFAAKELAVSLHRGRQTIARAKQDLAEHRSKLQPPKPDKTDVAGAILRQEIRSWLKGMGIEEQSKLFAERGTNLDPDIALAIAEAPVELSGVAPSQRSRVIDRLLRAEHGDAVDEIATIEAAIEKAETVVEASRELLSLDATSGDRKLFDEHAAPYERQADAPWLQRDGSGNVYVVDLAKGVRRSPTAEEMASGIFYENYEQYAADKGIEPKAA